jgi:hypothetical protein
VSTEPVCGYCSKPGVLHRDHVVPRSRGGPDDATNIVMACQPCNSAKCDQLPSEWLGDRCPPKVLLIEARVHAKLKSSFKSRDYRKAKPIPEVFAFSTDDNGDVVYIGRVISEAPTHIRIEAVNALLLWGGMWSLSGAMYDVPRGQVRLFNDRDSCVEAAERLMEKNHVSS